MAAPSTVSVFNIVRDTTGVGIANAPVHLILNYNQATVTATGDAIQAIQQSTTTDSTGKYSFTVVPNDLLSPANTTYTIVEPSRTYDIAPQSGNGASQQTTAAGVIVNQPGALAAATSNVTGPLTVQGAFTGQSTGTFSGEVSAPDFKATGLTGATAGGRYVGSTTSGAPASGTFSLGDWITTQAGGVWICTGAGSPGTWVPEGRVFWITEYGATTAASDNTTAIQNAIAAANASGGVVGVPNGVFQHASGLTYATTGIEIRGMSKSAELRYTGTAANPAHSITTGGIIFRGLTLSYSNVAFANTFINAASVNNIILEDCWINGAGGGSGANSSPALVSFDGSIDMTFLRCTFQAAQNGLRGQTSAVSSTNANSVIDCVFQNMVLGNIRNPGKSMTLEGCVFENLTNGHAGAVILDSTSFLTTGLSVNGCWTGDVTVTGGDQFQVNGSGVYFGGNTIGGIQGATTNGIHVIGASEGLGVVGNGFSFLTNCVLVDSGVAIPNFLFEGNAVSNNITNVVNATGTNISGSATAVRVGPSADAAGYKNTPFITGASTGGTGIGLENTSVGGRRYAIYSSGSANGIGAGTLTVIDDTAAANRLSLDSSGNFSVLTGGLRPATPAGASQTGNLWAGSGAPSNTNGANGDYYFRTDTPGTANQRIYVKSAGAWVGIV